MNRREFMKLSALIGGGLALSSFTFGDNMGYFKMEDGPVKWVHWTEGNTVQKKFIYAYTYRVESFEDFISKNWDINKSIFVYDVMNEPMNGMKYVRGAVLNIPHKSIILNRMCFDRNFKRLEVLKRYA